jgi:2',3'-cyclic-nucleotide 2'-phosphodiesterase (5'-nucleotidase family)
MSRLRVKSTPRTSRPGALALAEEGRQSLEFFSRLEPAVETFGNHDFDFGLDATRSVVRDSPQTWVATNLRDGDGPFAADLGVRTATVLERDGARVGVLGVTDTATPSMAPATEALTFEDQIASVRRETQRLRERGVDYVVVLAHVAESEAIAAETDVDAVLAGHIHDPRDAVIDGTVLTRPGANGRLVYEIDLASGDYTRHSVADAPARDDVRDALRRRMGEAGIDETVASVDEPLPRDRDTRLHGEFRVGNFVTDAFRWAANADVALQNVGGIREGPPLSEEVTVADVMSITPFDISLVVAEVTGAELRSLAHEADGGHLDGIPDYWLAQVSGMRIHHDSGGYAVTVDGTTPDDADQFRLATSEYLLHTDREFRTLTTDHRVETVDTVYEVLADYASEVGIDPELTGRLPDFD